MLNVLRVHLATIAIKTWFDGGHFVELRRRCILATRKGILTSYRLDSIKKGKRVKSFIVDGLDYDDLAVKSVLADCTFG